MDDECNVLGRESRVGVHHVHGDIGDKGDVLIICDDGLEVVQKSVVVVHLVYDRDGARPLLHGKRH